MRNFNKKKKGRKELDGLRVGKVKGRKGRKWKEKKKKRKSESR